MSSRFAVLGAGLMGRLLALELSRAGHSVTVYEKGGADGRDSAAFVAAAMLAPFAEAVATEPLIVELGIASLRRWPELLALLPERVFFQRNGTLVLWHAQDRDQAALFTARLRLMDRESLDKEHARELRGAELAELEPALAQRFARGLFLEDEGQLDNRGVLDALLKEIERHGVTVHWHQDVDPSRVNGDWVVDCRGLGAKVDWPALRGVRGEVIRVHTPDVVLNRPVRLLHPRYPIYIAPKPDGNFVIGATQIETEDSSPISVRSALELLSALYSVHPAFGEARIIEMASQCRPALPDNLPEIRWDGDKLIQVNGLFRHGFLIAPAVADAVMTLIAHALSGGREQWDAWRERQVWASMYRLTENEQGPNSADLH